ncbi:MAG: FMN-binding glutamate synthase family protein [Deltaproteobacteria bacterium]|nr:FMN-binding glutamate synthase family protein [Deltaproteobacteria bacterium]
MSVPEFTLGETLSACLSSGCTVDVSNLLASLSGWEWAGVVLAALVVLRVILDVSQRKHAIVHNFPLVGHLRYILETVGPELRQYIVTSNDEERPFSRDQRRWIYASSKNANNLFGFGTDNDLEQEANYITIKHAVFSLHDPHKGDPDFDPQYRIPSAKVMGAARGRAKAFRPASVVNVSAMSFGALGKNAVMALNMGCKQAGAMQNTGEGGISPYHQKGGDLVWQIGTGYFGCRDERGNFDLERLKQTVARLPIRMLEIKLSQGAKPSKGGILPAAKVTREIAAIRGVPQGQDCMSPATHKAFHDADSLLDFVERLAQETGLPVGIKSAVGQMAFWEELAAKMEKGDRGVDFITIDGGEGGTGAAPLVFADHVSLPFKIGMSRVYRLFAQRGLQDRITFIGSGKLGFPPQALVAFSLGCDMVNVAREAMLSIGCIQAQRCHTGHCPAGVATQNPWLNRGLDPKVKAVRAANYLRTFRMELLQVSRACGVAHPSLLLAEHLEMLDGEYGSRRVKDVFGYEDQWGVPSAKDQKEIIRIMNERDFGGD